MAKQLRITLVKSTISNPLRQKKTAQALGLKRIGRTVEQEDSPAVRGMINTIKHLVTVEEING
jgi:large subunit ribosomal protein L30